MKPPHMGLYMPLSDKFNQFDDVWKSVKSDLGLEMKPEG
jgi:hypothetical protein